MVDLCLLESGTMGLPQTLEAREFYRAAIQRFEDAQWLLEGERTTGAVYLAGYTVECFLKALILDGVAKILRNKLLDEFRGSQAHNIDWLGGLSRKHVGTTVPKEVTRHLTRIATWSTDLRYWSGSWKRREADEFMASVDAVGQWAKGRM
jgi:hypothetical protein